MDYKELAKNLMICAAVESGCICPGEYKGEVCSGPREESGDCMRMDKLAATAITELLDRAEAAEARCKDIETRMETAEKIAKEYQDTIVPGYRERAEKAEREAKEAQREATLCRNGWKKAEREKDAALKDLREAAWCMHCNNWEDMKKCMGLAKEGIRLCVLCKEKCACRDCEYGSKWKWRGAREE